MGSKTRETRINSIYFSRLSSSHIHVPRARFVRERVRQGRPLRSHNLGHLPREVGLDADLLEPRAVRDDARCAEKYGADWDAYTQRVPYVFVPGLV